jgi:hypothetical protein
MLLCLLVNSEDGAGTFIETSVNVYQMALRHITEYLEISNLAVVQFLSTLASPLGWAETVAH